MVFQCRISSPKMSLASSRLPYSQAFDSATEEPMTDGERVRCTSDCSNEDKRLLPG